MSNEVQSEILLSTMLNSVTEAAMALDPQYNVIFINDLAKEILGVNGDSVMGRNAYDVWPDAPDDVRFVEKTVRDKEEYYVKAMPYKWGKYNKYLDIRTSILEHQAGFMGAAVFFMDVTDTIAIQNELSERIDELSATLIPLKNKVALLPIYWVPGQSGLKLERTLKQVSEKTVKSLIIDLSTVREPDSDFIESLKKAKQALELLGVEVLISGIRPELARKWVETESDYNDFKFINNVSTGLSRFID
ncbi:STAS domain-containing protein [Mesobacillus selenatarsenatis]|uniref:RsbR, positive regulator of sigma-B n=1 Tax=Mesobacillus selenatarsenatis (strain DSM 18680 / JCM 14380 / FERM P-15431 / SF-1) TaxID=1321606 RepID=A0A0A8X0C5_MESS1|nr:STAS domain-containing protein [Mesobacillus selenatarsenatis]GAM12457.1 RsbR, positive regulator of sigma-B [Mesobacillus selenatarsenatis SF-1]